MQDTHFPQNLPFQPEQKTKQQQTFWVAKIDQSDSQQRAGNTENLQIYRNKLII